MMSVFSEMNSSIGKVQKAVELRIGYGNRIMEESCSNISVEMDSTLRWREILEEKGDCCRWKQQDLPPSKIILYAMDKAR